MTKKIGFIGQGWIGKNYADNFEERGYEVARYAMEEPYIRNKEKIKDCDIVFIAVPTPTTPNGFDDNILRTVVSLVGNGKIAVIKSTLLPGTTESIQASNKNIFLMHSPEFLSEATAAYDAANPKRNIIGIPNETSEFKQKAQDVLAVLPFAPYTLICRASEAELIKYGGNCLLYLKVIFNNIMYDTAEALGINWDNVRDGMAADPRLGASHWNPTHQNGRGAGGHCFIKDFAAFYELYKNKVDDKAGLKFLESVQYKNIELLIKSKKDLDLLRGVYGDNIIDDF